jgi:signal transduction histidine kinase
MQAPPSSVSEFGFKNLFATTPNPYLILDPALIIVEVNNAYLLATQRNRGDLLGKYVFDAFPDNPDDPQANGVTNLHCSLQRVLHNRATDIMEVQRYDIPVGNLHEGRFEERYWSPTNTPMFDRHGVLTHIIHHVEDITARVRSEIALRESEKRFRALTNATSDVIYRMSPDWGQMHDLDGRGFLKDTTSIDQWKLEDYVPPQDQNLVRKAVEEAIRNKTIFELEHRVLRADGSTGWTYSRAVPILDADGKITDWIGAASDITARKVAELNIQAKTERYQTLFDSIDEGFAIIELIFDAESRPMDYRFLEANPIFEAQTGLAEVVGRTARELVPDLEQRWFDIYGNVALTGKPTRITEGSAAMNRWFNVYATRVGDQDRRTVAILFKDITAQKHNEAERERLLKAAQTSHDQLMAVFQQAPAFMCILRGPEHVFDTVNERYQQLIGGRDVIGKTVREALPEVIEQGFIQLLDDVYQTGKPFIGNGLRFLLQPDADGLYIERFVDFVYLPLRDAGNQIYGILVHGIDITERKRTDEELRVLADKLSDTDRRKDEFLAMLAHELRNPLAPIGAAAELLQLVKLDEERIRQTSEVISRQVRHMTGMVDDLLDVSRVTRGLIKLEDAALDIRQIIADAVEQVNPLIRRRGHYLALHLAPQEAMVRGDKKRLVQVLANILNNAAKYTHEGGHIGIRTEVQDARIFIEITDDGIGMAPELAERVFDLFAQAERTSDRSSGGLGLGLALVKNLVELHGGTVTCRSAGLGQGSNFSVCLPRILKSEDYISQETEETVRTRTSAALRILVVDDNVDAATMLGLVLTTLGHEVLVEHGSCQALERAKVEKPDVCLLDIGLPEMDGNELAQRLRAHPETKHCILVAVTGYGQEGDREKAFAAGFQHHLVKPIDTKQLAAVLGGICLK